MMFKSTETMRRRFINHGRHLSAGNCFIAVIVGLLAVTETTNADIAPDEVLVVFNAASADAVALKNTYLAAHPGIPAANVLALNDATLITSNLTYTDFVNDVRNPIRDFLSAPGAPTPSDIIAIVLIRPFPHRVLDTDNALVGDNPNGQSNELLVGDITDASVDAELVLLWQNLDSGEAGGTMDSKSDNMIDNPYHQSATQIDLFSRASIQTQKSFTAVLNVAWFLAGAGATRLTAGDMYLVCRIDGDSLADAEASIERAQDLRINKALVRILLDEYDVSGNADLDDDSLFTSGDPFIAGDDYEETRNVLQADGWDVRYDGTFDFIDSTEETSPLIGYASYGENHDISGLGANPPGANTYIDNFLFPPGAIFNTLESYNGRALNGLGTLFGLEQATDFIAAGGTFAVGHVWEPFTFSLPDNEFLMVNMLSGQLTWAEAAYTSLPALSWHQIVFGDPLAKAVILNDPGLPPGDLNGNGRADGPDIQLFVDLVLNGPASYHATFPTLDPIARGDFTADFSVDVNDAPGFIAALLLP